MRFKMSLLLGTIQQAGDIEIWYNIMKFNMSLLLDKIQLVSDVEIWYTTSKSQESPCRPMLRNACCTGYWLAGAKL